MHKISLILRTVLLYFTNFATVLNACRKHHFTMQMMFCNMQRIPTEMTFVPQSFPLSPLSKKQVLILASRAAFHFSSILAGDKSKVTK